MAGAWAAYCAAEAGFAVDVYERREAPGRETSGNAAAVVIPALSIKPHALSEWTRAGFELVTAMLARLGDEVHWNPCGMVMLPVTGRQQKNHDGFRIHPPDPDYVRIVDVDEASRLAGVSLPSEALYMPRAGWADPARLCAKLLQHPAVTLHLNAACTDLAHENGAWRLQGDAPVFPARADAVVLAAAAEVTRFSRTAWLPLRANRGQLTYLRAADLPWRPRAVLCYDGYATPAPDDRLVVGATFSRELQQTEMLEADHQENLESLARHLPFEAWRHQLPRPLEGRVAFRSQSMDHVPIAGPVPDLEAFERVYARLWDRDARLEQETPPYWPHLYVSTAHAARGMVNAPIAGALIAARLSGRAAPVDESLATALHPARFLARRLRKGPP